jgi:hypothetical protein
MFQKVKCIPELFDFSSGKSLSILEELKNIKNP